MLWSSSAAMVNVDRMTPLVTTPAFARWLDASGAHDLLQVIAAERAEPAMVHNDLILPGLPDRDQFACNIGLTIEAQF